MAVGIMVDGMVVPNSMFTPEFCTTKPSTMVSTANGFMHSPVHHNM